MISDLPLADVSPGSQHLRWLFYVTTVGLTLTGAASLIPDISYSKPDVGADLLSDAAHFNTTHWSVVLLAGQSEAAKAEEALDQLCQSYWFPLYAYVRRKGHSPHDAQDLTQEFFARLLDKNYIRLAKQERGRFRSFLLKSLNHFLVNDWVRDQAQKRGCGQKLLSLVEEAAERLYLEDPANQLAPEAIFDKKWAVTLLERAMNRLAADYSAGGKAELFDGLKGLLLVEGSAEACGKLAVRLRMTEGAVKVALHRLRHRFGEVVRLEIAQTVASPAEVDEELRALVTVLSA